MKTAMLLLHNHSVLRFSSSFSLMTLCYYKDHYHCPPPPFSFQAWDWHLHLGLAVYLYTAYHWTPFFADWYSARLPSHSFYLKILFLNHALQFISVYAPSNLMIFSISTVIVIVKPLVDGYFQWRNNENHNHWRSQAEMKQIEEQ